MTDRERGFFLHGLAIFNFTLAAEIAARLGFDDEFLTAIGHEVESELGPIITQRFVVEQ